ncbi:MAG: Fpg/Nei family DNA glycosylase [Bacteroidales bacterium]|nr:Fpg/Nei family DNA glycosylase [Bacteroidales bacterium]
MPELPDVEIFRRYAEEHALNQEIKKVSIEDDKIAATSPQTISESLRDRQLKKAERIGKYLFLPTERQSVLVMHFGMTGWLEYQKHEKSQYTKASLNFSNGYHLCFVNPRKLGRLHITDNIQEFCRYMEIGPDALAIGEGDFIQKMKKKRGMLKSALMDQSFLSGLGNIYSDEILFQAGLHPKTRISRLNEAHIGHLFSRMKEVLSLAIEHRANPDNMPDHFIIPHRKEGSICPSCGGEVQKDKLSGRGYYFCPRCQAGEEE